MTTPFAGLSVVDLSDRLSGAFAARLFGDFGAEVILAEPPEGHPLRREPPFLDDQPGAERSVLHAYVNWNKLSIVVSSLDQIGELIASADVVITSADPVSSAPYASALSRLSNDAVHLSVTAHGLTGPLAGRPGNNLTSSARTGWSYINRLKDEPALQMPHDQAGYVGGVAGYIAAAAALRRRDQTDTAELADVAEVEAFAQTVAPWGIASIYADVGFSNGPAGGRPRGAPGVLFDLKDGRMNFGIADFRNWGPAMKALELPEFADVEELIPDLGRHSKDLREVVFGMARTLPNLDRWDVFHSLAKLRCLVGVLQDIDDIVNDDQLTARGFLVETEIEGKKTRAAGAIATLSPSPWKLSSPAPKLDQDRTKIAAKPKEARSKTEPLPLEAMSPEAMAEGPLSGTRVLSFGQAWSGTFSTQLLSLLGADVVQVGALHRPDVWRRTAALVPKGIRDENRKQYALNTQGLYNSVNLNKREFTLDLRQEKGVEILWKLLPNFDILTDNFRPNVIPSWGITLEKLHELRPGYIWASISGYGTEGPYWQYPANGATTEPMAGLSSIHGYEGDQGMNTGGLYPDPIAGYFMVATLLAAMNHRDRTGEPQRVDLSMMEAITAICGDAVVEYDATGRLPQPRGNHHPRMSPHNNYDAKNGEWLAIAVDTDAAFRALADHIGDPRLGDEKFASMASRKANEAELDAIIADWTVRQDAREADHALGLLGINAARVAPLYELYSLPDPDFRESGFVTEIDHVEAGKTWLPGRPWRFSGAASAPLRPAPCVGEHSREVLKAELGIDDAEYEALVAAGVTGTLDDLDG